MELKEKHIKTKLGLIPKGWTLSELGEVLKVRHGKDQKQVESSDGKYPILGTGGLMGYADSYLYASESVLIGRKGTIDKPQFMDKPFWTVDTLFYTEIKKTCLPKFIFYRSNLIDWYSHNEASGVPSLNAKTIEKIKIPIPPLPEQKAIVEVLSDTDKLIQSLEKQIAKKHLIKKGVMQRLLAPKEDWEKKQIGELAEVVGGGTPSTTNSNYWNGKINWFTPTEIGDTKYVRKSLRKLTREGLKQSSAQLLPIGTILLTSRAGIGDISITMEEASTNQGFQSLIVNEGVHNEFLYYLMLTKKEVLLQYASGSTFLEISPRMVRQIAVFVPSYNNQMKIATTLSNMDNEIESLVRKLNKYKTLKKGLMQNLLTGKIRLV